MIANLVDKDSISEYASRAVEYFQKRQSVFFLSYCRFWEKHGFVQQSLVQFLVDSNVKVTWWDGAGWRPYRPTQNWHSRLLKIKQLKAFPGERLPYIKSLSISMQAEYLKNKIQKHDNPVIWIQGGIEDALAEELPYIDVFSTFDDPYRNERQGALASKAKLIVCQNNVAYEHFSEVYPDKCIKLFPPVEMDRGYGGGRPLEVPPGFPTKRMGYIGSFFGKDYDLELFEYFVENFPEWGFILIGRTDKLGKNRLNRLKKYLNFLYIPWVPRESVAKMWNILDVCLLFYRDDITQSGAFPVKVLEAFHAGVPCISTKGWKTEDLEGVIPRSNDWAELSAMALQAPSTDPKLMHDHFEKFYSLMHPQFHLGTVADYLSQKS